MKGRLTRSYGVEDDEDLVVELADDGSLRIRAEPVTRRLRRGEVLPEVVVDVRKTWDERKKDDASPHQIERIIDRVIARLPIADLSGTPEKVGYQAKVWLLNELRRETKQEQS